MPLPKPNSGQKEKNFMENCMSSPTMNKEYKDAQKVMEGQLTAAASKALQKTADKGAKAAAPKDDYKPRATRGRGAGDKGGKY